MSPERAIRICIFVDLLAILWGSISFGVAGIAAAVYPSPNVTYEYNCGQSPLYEMYGQPINDYANRPIIGFTIIFLCILYAYIFTIASKKAKEAATRRGETVSTREMKITKTSAIVLLGYTLCIAPSILKDTVQGYIDAGSTWLVWYPWFTDFILISNSMINPFIYAGRSKLVRKDFSETIYFIFGKMCPRLLRQTKESKALRPQSSKPDIGSSFSDTGMSLTNISKSFSNSLND
ncbi:adenosine receptor A2a-like [Anneissia japonica]|uniref:adenosine receptor A2a-like n=1 Tax=Anneissia japonica TaxID=1529436 RepID=UPI001425B9DD|nr:adenosine receptor A2a-like [Anneissia japonica]